MRSVGQVLAVIALMVLPGCHWYTRWANGVNISAHELEGASSRLDGFSEKAGPANLKFQRVPASGYVRFVVDRICFAELPSAFGDLDDSWVGVTMLSDLTGSDGTLFNEFVHHLGQDQQARGLLDRVHVTPPQRLLTNANSCVSGAAFRSPLLKLENSATVRRPRFLFTSSVLFSDQVKQYTGLAQGLAQELERTGQKFGVNLSTYLQMSGQIIDSTQSFMRLLAPDRIILWGEAALPVRAVPEDASVLEIPAENQRFLRLFTDQRIVGRGHELGCPLSQKRVEELANSGSLTLEDNFSRVNVPDDVCPNGTYGQPYMVWHVEWLPSADIDVNYWDIVSEIAVRAASNQQGFAYLDQVQRLSNVLTSQTRSVLTTAQRDLFIQVEDSLKRSLLALRLAGDGVGNVCDSLEATDKLLRKNLVNNWGAPNAVVESLKALNDRLKTVATDQRAPCIAETNAPWPPSAASGGTYVVDVSEATRYIPFMKLPDGFTLKFSPAVEHAKFDVDLLDAGQNVTIDLRRSEKAPPASSGGEGGGQGDYCNSGERGGAGNTGASGIAGVKLQMNIVTARNIGSIWVRADGGPGGSGGPGGTGGLGGPASCLNRGRCNAGNGGKGGTGGTGGRGGDTGKLDLTVRTPLGGFRVAPPRCEQPCIAVTRPSGVSGMTNSLVVSGAPGCGGSGGEGGPGGSGHPGKDCSWPTGDRSGGSNGSQGSTGDQGQNGACVL
ncbi:hypothetical protein COCOR_01552 [Corallococcus coralloides DSM 2259]|uniref:Uncharacterized protein n=1 Tax=Corallococcus coralloides (strain ATCC 25202 / DSM 2259 / NBRC 100086 / M2) TaxID=1144275 RepID=H8MWX5_CORCM|nr:hypothetical protein COCOR_01552 [Corallococcus coralloides DSM 2259]